MSELLIRIDDADYEMFKQMVGKGKVNVTIKNYIKAYAQNNDVNESVLVKKLEILGKEKDKVDAEYFQVKASLDYIRAKRSASELVQLETERAQDNINRDAAHQMLKSSQLDILRKIQGVKK